MAKVTIYTKPLCGYCTAAKHLLKSKGATWTEIDILDDEKLSEEMIQRSGGRLTTPQIFINNKHIGGFDDLSALDQAGKLDMLLWRLVS